jgi:hypothetical protein
MKTGIAAKGEVKIIVTHKDKTQTIVEVPNLIVTAGLVDLATLLASNTLADPYDHIALGTDETPPDWTQTGLINEVARSAATVEQLGGSDATMV